MDDMVRALFSIFSRWRTIRYTSATYANFITLSGYLRLPDQDPVKAIKGLAGGGLGRGSTCGVVSGGCLAIAAAHLADIVGDRGKGEDLYRRILEFTTWFEETFSSTLCSELCGEAMNSAGGVLAWLYKGKAIRRCCRHVGIANAKAVEFLDRPLEKKNRASSLDRRLAESGGYCAAEVLSGIRGETGLGSLYLEQLSVALDGGIGLSGGLCGALAGAILPLSLADDISRSILGRTLLLGNKSHLNRFMAEFKRVFGSFECRDLTKLSFSSGNELAAHIGTSGSCTEIKYWCRREASQLISAISN
ncbi:MAG: hypothetical protein A2W01_07070 [Candidatus Solincola sediminis]|uniref:C_GCAxxG_C_C family protein n=1 Tax=Candidatus Solincola sediminis TaxID=1797199 RepID=A0A1F2WMY2_9ACTN|nr:MAG: hypothetical protein A2W01_07070 [Candidatus Solincola sediminis]OFW58192.1 MAG: hypothetical protein A2Y75_08515 [Candidatus Solincola sediminis]